MEWIYLDNNATTRPCDEVIDAMAQVNTSLWANPSSVHRFGQMVRQRIELARSSVASLIGAREREIIFTSGGTESNNLALRGTLGPALGMVKQDGQPPVLITTPIEHAAIRQVADDWARAGVEVHRATVGREGVVDASSIASVLDKIAQDSQPGRVVLISVQWANNETGAIQPLGEIAQIIAHQRTATPRLKIRLHTDATQAVGKIPVDVNAFKVDMLTLAGHKFHGPKATGALYVRSGVRVMPQNPGGAQERERRGGTENTVGIVGMGVAAGLAAVFVNDTQQIDRLRAMRDRFEQGVITAVNQMDNPDGVKVIAQANAPADPAKRLWNTSNIGFAPLEAEAILLGLSEQGICASAGAACSSGSLDPSPVLLAMGVPEPAAHGSVRFSISKETTEEQIDKALAQTPQVVVQLARSMPAML